jgi:hypothetical protein
MIVFYKNEQFFFSNYSLKEGTEGVLDKGVVLFFK